MHLLQVVEERVYSPVGSTRSRPCRARIVVTANRSLEQEISAGRFRADLFYRLSVVNLTLPPLRSRRASILPLFSRFFHHFRPEAQGLPAISLAALEALEAYDWPGNIRELRNVVERTLALCTQDAIELQDLPEYIQRSGGSPTPQGEGGEALSARQELHHIESVDPGTLEAARRRAEREQLVDALRRHNNNRTNAAAELGISRVTLYSKLHRCGLL